jgi:hypothetical protein
MYHRTMLTEEVRAPEPTKAPAWANQRVLVAAAILCAALSFVAGPAFDYIRLDPIVQSTSVQSADEIVEARKVLEAFNLLDDANGLYGPLLILQHVLPATLLAGVALGVGLPRQSRRTRWALAAGAAVVLIVMMFPFAVYGDTVSDVSRIVD